MGTPERVFESAVNQKTPPWRGFSGASKQNRTVDLFSKGEGVELEHHGSQISENPRILLGSFSKVFTNKPPESVSKYVISMSDSTPAYFEGQCATREIGPRIEATMNSIAVNTETVTWLTRAEAASFLRLAPRTLANWASADTGPAYTRMGRGRVLYQLADIESWLAAQDRLCA